MVGGVSSYWPEGCLSARPGSTLLVGGVSSYWPERCLSRPGQEVPCWSEVSSLLARGCLSGQEVLWPAGHLGLIRSAPAHQTMDAFLASLGLPMPAAAAAAAAPPAESAFVRQVIHVVDMRRLLFTFLEWDGVIGLAPVCKATAALVSGRSATSVERNEAIVRFVLRAILSTTLQHYITWDYAAPAHEQGERAAKRYADFEAWRALPTPRRLLCLDEPR